MIGAATRRGGARAAVALLTVLASFVLVATTVATAAATNSPSNVSARLVKQLSGLTGPVAVTSARDGVQRLFVTEQRGDVRLVTGTTRLQSQLYLDIRSKVATGGNEQGMLSIAFDPRFSQHPYLWAAYTRASDGALVVSRFHASSPTATSVSASTEVQVLVVPHPQYTNHNGGQLMFGHDGDLYISTGDGGGEGDPLGNAEKLTSLSGKILRIDAEHFCGSQHYCVPSNNPYAKASNANQRLVFDWGLRNAWRFSFDDGDGTLWIGDVGQDAYEEVDHGTVSGGRDFGWSCREAKSTYNSSRCAGRHMVPPAYAYSHGSNDSNGCAIIGGFAYHGKAYSFATGLYFFTDYCSGHLWATGRSSTGGYPTALVGSAGGNVTGFGEDDGREIFAVNQSGGLYRLVVTKR